MMKLNDNILNAGNKNFIAPADKNRFPYGLYIAMFLAMLSVISCKKEYNTAYKPVNDLSLSNKTDTVSVNLGDSLKITPVISQSLLKDNANLKYQWSVVIPGASRDTTVVVWATTRNLAYKPSLAPQSGFYYINYKVTDQTTGITFRKVFPLLVTSNYTHGWMLLENNGSTADIDFANVAIKKSFYHLFSAANPTVTLPASTKSLSVSDLPATATSGTSGSNTNVPAQTVSMVLYANNGYLFDYATYQIVIPFSQYIVPAPANLQPQFVTLTSPTSMSTIISGQLYSRFADYGQLTFGGTPYRRTDNLPYYLSSAGSVALKDGARFYYDETNLGFLVDLGSSYGLNLFPCVPFDPTNTISSSEKLLSIGPGQGDQWFAAITSNSADNNCYLYLGDDQKYYYNYPLYAPEGIYNRQVLDNPKAINSPSFCFEQNNGQFFYSVDNNIYINAYASYQNASTLSYSFPAGEVITNMKISSDESYLTVATYKGGAGSVYFFSLDQSGLIKGSYTNSFTGFGKVIDMQYKQ